MRFRRLLALSTAAALLAVAAPGTYATDVAWAAGPALTVLYTVDTNGDGSHGIAKSFTDGTGSQLIAESAPTHYDELDASPVGEGVVYTKYVGTSIGLYADNRQLTSPRLLYAAHLAGALFHIPYYPSFSPDGRTILFTVLEYNAAQTVVETHLERVPFAGGTSRVVGGSSGLFDASFHPADPTVIAASRWAGDQAAVTGTLNGTTLTYTPVPRTATTDFVHFSPDGSSLVFVVDNKTLTVTSTTGTVLRTVDGSKTAYPVWLDSSSVLFTMAPAGASGGDIFRLDIAGAAPTQLTTSASDEHALANPRANDPAPGAPTTIKAALNGTHPVISWTRPIDGDIADIVVRRALGTTAPSTITDGDAVSGGDGASVPDTVTIGETYSYALFAVDAAQQVSLPASVTIRALATPRLSVPALAWQAATVVSIPVSWAATGTTDTHFRVSIGVGRAPKIWQTWYSDTTRTSAVFGSGSRPLGGTYSVRVSAIDGHGNATAAATSSVLVPSDDTVATFSRGWVRWSASSFWLHSERVARSAGLTVSMRFTGKKLQVIGTRCPVCGTFKVFLDNHYRGTYSSTAATTKQRQVLYTSTFATLGTHTIVLVSAGPRERPQLRLDAFAVSR